MAVDYADGRFGRRRMARRGEQFERAVADFFKSLDADAVVLFDHKVADRDTGSMRQVDVWVTHRLFGHFPINVLVSCKDHSRPLDIGEVESLISEMRSTGATMGVLYGRSGFTANAVAKARAHGISCCRLFDNAPPECPADALIAAFLAYPIFDLAVERLDSCATPGVRWRDVLRTPVGSPGDAQPLCEVIARLCPVTIGQYLTHVDRTAQSDWMASLDVPGSAKCPPFKLHLILTWAWFQADLDAFRLTGSANSMDGGFKGSVTISPVPIRSPASAAAWKPCHPPGPVADGLRVTFTAFVGPTRAAVVGVLNATRVFRGKPWRLNSPSLASLNDLLRSASLQGQPMMDGIEFTADFNKSPPAPH